MAKSKKTPKNTKVKVEDAPNSIGGKYILRLFVTGNLPNSARAIINIKAICEKYLKDAYELEIVDIYQQPLLALTDEIIAIPVLIKKFPLPEERLIGDLSDVEMVLKGLHLTNN
ncbi:MAG: circadian clock protein KaiB [Ferruginibacter sp.]|nr:circadian clock protein KaiB [Ferruginibacter sp.]